ncbi:hypothetical protein NP493_830g01014 [Ridgeia piscesae]|uniref:lysozyme n=1 Tax=Ridgeia piscesae TaxID=27915 RepID=A0AAD9NMQ6_RIDPI|nr:hypothetical protein NP493_830g01014 [Ridgeia piscesae]
MSCSRRCVRAYLAKYSNGHRHSCEYYARVHRGGPYGWKSRTTNAFWKKANTIGVLSCNVGERHYLRSLPSSDGPALYRSASRPPLLRSIFHYTRNC